jgi:undecaprenyl-diphosphatase
MVSALSTSFPSGHALGVMVSVAALLTVVLPVVRPALRGWLVALGIAVILVVGIGRVVLNVHHPSDVIAGWALGYAYFVACLLLVWPSVPVIERAAKPAVLDNAR